VRHYLSGIPAVILAVGMLALSCSSSSAADCERAAADQAFAEQRWQDEFQEHALADEAVSENPDSSSALTEHDHSSEALFSARVEMILAENKTRRECR